MFALASLGVAKAENLKLEFMAKIIGVNFFQFEYIFRSYKDTKTLLAEKTL